MIDPKDSKKEEVDKIKHDDLSRFIRVNVKSVKSKSAVAEISSVKVGINETYKKILDFLSASDGSIGSMMYNGKIIEKPEENEF